MNLFRQLSTIEGFQRPLFGRESDLQACEKAWATLHKPLCLYGVSGVGKTALAQELYHRNKEHIAHAVWLTVRDSIAACLIENEALHTGLNIKITRYDYNRYSFDNYLVGSVLGALRKLPTLNALNKENPEAKYRYNLLVIDNITDQTKDVDLLKQMALHSDWHIVVTSRFQMDLAHNYKVDVLAPEAACQLFRHYCKRADGLPNSLLEPIIRELHQHPFSIEMVAKHAQIAKSLALEDLKLRLHGQEHINVANRKIYLPQNNDAARQANMISCLSFCFTMAKMESLHPNALRLLKFLALLSNRPFMLSELTYLLVEENLFTTNLLESALDHLCHIGWLTEGTSCYYLHAAAADFILYDYLYYLSDTEKIDFAADWVKHLARISERKIDQNMIPHLYFLSLLPRIKNFIEGLYANEFSEFYNKIGCLLQVLGHKKNSLEYNQKALVLAKNINPDDRVDMVTYYTNLSLAYELNGFFTEALKYKNEALNCSLRLFGEDNLETVLTYQILAMHHVGYGEKPKGIEIGKKAFAMREKLVGDKGLEHVQSYTFLATLYKQAGDNEKSLEIYLKIIEIQESLLGSCHKDTQLSYTNTGFLYNEILTSLNQRDLDTITPESKRSREERAAKKIACKEKEQNIKQKALDIALTLFGEQHLVTASCYANLGLSYEKAEDYKQKKAFLEKALDIWKKEEGDHHLEAAISQFHLAMIYTDLHDWENAYELIETSCQIYKDFLGENDAQIEIFKKTRNLLKSMCLNKK
ncbi:MAG: hypothetical protein RI894_2428 [Bacteroidota bacterium]|jgi:tetratricopeptide (TPR) repeat protein